MHHHQLILCAVIFLIVHASCAPEPKGDFRFLGSDEVVEGKALTYVYRPPSILGDSAVCNLIINDELVGGLQAGQYTFRFLPPGKTRFEAGGTSPAFVTVNLRENHQYFIRQTWCLRATGFHPLVDNMTKVKAEPGLKLCSYIEKPKEIEEIEESEEKQE